VLLRYRLLLASRTKLEELVESVSGWSAAALAGGPTIAEAAPAPAPAILRLPAWSPASLRPAPAPALALAAAPVPRPEAKDMDWTAGAFDAPATWAPLVPVRTRKRVAAAASLGDGDDEKPAITRLRLDGCDATASGAMQGFGTNAQRQRRDDFDWTVLGTSATAGPRRRRRRRRRRERRRLQLRGKRGHICPGAADPPLVGLGHRDRPLPSLPAGGCG
jgi:hypothetical protein